MYYLVKLRFEVEGENQKIKKVKENHLIEATSIGEAESTATERFGRGISPCFIECVQESKIMSVIEKN